MRAHHSKHERGNTNRDPHLLVILRNLFHRFISRESLFFSTAGKAHWRNACHILFALKCVCLVVFKQLWGRKQNPNKQNIKNKTLKLRQMVCDGRIPSCPLCHLEITARLGVLPLTHPAAGSTPQCFTFSIPFSWTNWHTITLKSHLSLASVANTDHKMGLIIIQ